MPTGLNARELIIDYYYHYFEDLPALPHIQWRIQDRLDLTIERKNVSMLLTHLGNNRVAPVLDIGCGTGGTLLTLKMTLGSMIIGMDLDFEALKASKALLLAAHQNPLLVQANAEALPFKSGVFPLIVCYEVLEHVIAPPRTLLGMLVPYATTDLFI